jgi:hypothetical protein
MKNVLSIPFVITITLLIGVALSQRLSAQEYTYGKQECYDAGKNGVQQTFLNGQWGFVSVGASYSSSENCSSSDAYIVRTGPGGIPLWWHNVDITGTFVDDSAMSVAEVFDGVDDGVFDGYIVTGVTHKSSTNTDFFVMKFGPTGVLQWTKTYGNLYRDEVALDVAIAKSPGRLLGGLDDDGYQIQSTQQYDILICGYVIDKPNNSTRKIPFIVRLDQNGNIIWDNWYVVQADPGAWFNALIEATPVDAGQSTGDIVAVGGTAGVIVGGANSPQAIVARVDGDFGLIQGPPQGGNPAQTNWEQIMTMYGGSNDDQFWSVLESQTTSGPVGATTRNLVMAGYFTYSPQTGPINREIYVVKSQCSPGTPIVQSLYGDGINGNLFEEARDVMEESAPSPRQNSLALTGYTVTGYGDRDMFLLEIPSTLTNPTINRRFGRPGPFNDDIGNSICGSFTQNFWFGFTMIGESSSNLAGWCPRDPGEHYFVSTPQLIGAEYVGCDMLWSPVHSSVWFNPESYTPTIRRHLLHDVWDEDPWWYAPPWYEKVCSTETGTGTRPIQYCKPTLPGSGEQGNPTTGDGSQREIMLSIFPNPIVGGSDVAVVIQPTSSEPLVVKVVDEQGNTMRQSTEPNGGKETTIHVPTGELPAGTYAVHVSEGMKTNVVRFVVIR